MLTSTTRSLLAAVVAATSIGAAVVAPHAVAAPSAMVQVGVNPASLAQPTASGKSITDIRAHDGKVFLGIGDWNYNSGPTPVVAYDPVSGAFEQEFVSPSEAVHRFAVVGEDLYAPSTDPVGSTRVMYAQRDASDTWTGRSGMSMTHVFDWGSRGGKELLAVGSADNRAEVWRSTDGGAVWSRSLAAMPASSTGIARFMDLWVLNGRAWVQASDSKTSRVFDGTSWSTAALDFHAAAMKRPVQFRNVLVGRGWYGGNGVFDGRSFRKLPYTGPNAVSGGTLFTLDAMTRVVHATTDLVTWRPVATAPYGAVSITADESGRVFVGTNTGAVWATPSPLA